MEKYFSVPSVRVNILRSRHMDIKNSDQEKFLLNKYNYYNLVNGYKDPFLHHGSSTTERYITGTKLSELEELLKFDTNLRLLFLKQILKIEEIFKNQMVQSFFAYHLNNNVSTKEEKANLHRDSEYLRRKYYNLNPLYTQHTINNYGIVSTVVSSMRPRNQHTTWDRQSTYDNYIATVYKTLGQQRRNKNKSIKTYLEQHGYMPMWVLMNVLTFGNVSHLFTLQKEEVQKDIIRSLNLISLPGISTQLSVVNTARILQILSIFRNICAHNERFYNTSIKVPIDDIFINFGRKLPHTVDPSSGRRLNDSQKKKRLNARQGIYALIFIISLFIDNSELDSFIKEIRDELNKLSQVLTTIPISEIERLMGLNFNWFDLIKNK